MKMIVKGVVVQGVLIQIGIVAGQAAGALPCPGLARHRGGAGAGGGDAIPEAAAGAGRDRGCRAARPRDAGDARGAGRTAAAALIDIGIVFVDGEVVVVGSDGLGLDADGGFAVVRAEINTYIGPILAQGDRLELVGIGLAEIGGIVGVVEALAPIAGVGVVEIFGDGIVGIPAGLGACIGIANPGGGRTIFRDRRCGARTAGADAGCSRFRGGQGVTILRIPGVEIDKPLLPAIMDDFTVVLLEAVANISNRTPTARGGGGGSRGPRTGGKRMFSASHESTVQKTSTSCKP
ncbi:hypothetical protein [Bordetella genomosp. 1]|uniref:hypothetical protein n=1 Tax=Bordetella genomosp. 1 TaxID=1395607 RepID=UPI0015955C13|nr:hypothetical protein [Bordetella genomosp. 1]